MVGLSGMDESFFSGFEIPILQNHRDESPNKNWDEQFLSVRNDGSRRILFPFPLLGRFQFRILIRDLTLLHGPLSLSRFHGRPPSQLCSLFLPSFIMVAWSTTEGGTRRAMPMPSSKLGIKRCYELRPRLRRPTGRSDRTQMDGQRPPLSIRSTLQE